MLHYNARQFNITLINIPGDVNLWVRIANETHWSTKDNDDSTVEHIKDMVFEHECWWMDSSAKFFVGEQTPCERIYTCQ